LHTLFVARTSSMHDVAKRQNLFTEKSSSITNSISGLMAYPVRR
jgi:hypothetical protein